MGSVKGRWMDFHWWGCCYSAFHHSPAPNAYIPSYSFNATSPPCASLLSAHHLPSPQHLLHPDPVFLNFARGLGSSLVNDLLGGHLPSLAFNMGEGKCEEKEKLQKKWQFESQKEKKMETWIPQFLLHWLFQNFFEKNITKKIKIKIPIKCIRKFKSQKTWINYEKKVFVLNFFILYFFSFFKMEKKNKLDLFLMQQEFF